MSYLAATPLDLERALTFEIAGWVTDFRLKSPIDRGAMPVPITVVQGFVPSYYAGPEVGNQDKAPVISVRCTSGFYMRERGKVIANIMILCWDDDVSRGGYQDCLNIANHLIFNLQQAVGVTSNDLAGNQPRTVTSFVLADDPIHFMEVVDPFKDFFPYFVCGLEPHFWVPAATPPAAIFPRPRPMILEGGTEGWYEPQAMPVPEKSKVPAK
jgi:hypothetical protein